MNAQERISELLGTAQSDLDNWKEEIEQLSNETDQAEERERLAERQATMTEFFPLLVAAPALLAALKEIERGSQTGRWLDEQGDQCSEDDPGATWRAYTLEEQVSWLEHINQTASAAIKLVTR